MTFLPKELFLQRGKNNIIGNPVIKSPHSLEQTLAELLLRLGPFSIVRSPSEADSVGDYRIDGPQGRSLHLQAKTYQRLTPAIAESAFPRMKNQSEQMRSEPLVFASVVSDRTAEIAKEYGVSWIDFAGNCHLILPSIGIYVHRCGIRNPFGKTMSSRLNVFSTKSSRAVRVMLQEPSRGWRLGELAEHSDVRISNGLMSRIKKSLLEDGYALMHEGELRLKSPEALLRDWVDHYRRDKPNIYSFYMRGDLQQVETQVASWCSESNIAHALSRFSAAWRLAPQVRYSVASFLVSAEAITETSLQRFRDQCGARQVDSGANLILQVPEDESHFVGRISEPLQIASPLQTYLDLMTMESRGEEAANSIYEKYLAEPFSHAAQEVRALL